MFNFVIFKLTFFSFFLYFCCLNLKITQFFVHVFLLNFLVFFRCNCNLLFIYCFGFMLEWFVSYMNIKQQALISSHLEQAKQQIFNEFWEMASKYLNRFYVEWVMQVIKKHRNKHIFHISIYVAITKQELQIWNKQSK